MLTAAGEEESSDSDATGDGDGDTTGDGDGDTGDGDGDDDPATEGDGDGDPDTTGDGDGDTTGDGDGDPDTGDGDGDTPTDEVLLDFATEFCDFGVETLISFDPGGEGVTFPPCPSEDKLSPIGGALAEDSPTLDNGMTYPGPQLLIYPPFNDAMNAHISLQFKYVAIEAGDRLQFHAGCGAGKQTCDAVLQINYFNVEDEVTSLFFNVPEQSDGESFDVDMPLDELAGQSISLSLVVFANSNAGDDGIYFADGRIVRPAAAP